MGELYSLISMISFVPNFSPDFTASFSIAWGGCRSVYSSNILLPRALSSASVVSLYSLPMGLSLLSPYVILSPPKARHTSDYLSVLSMTFWPQIFFILMSAGILPSFGCPRSCLSSLCPKSHSSSFSFPAP